MSEGSHCPPPPVLTIVPVCSVCLSCTHPYLSVVSRRGPATVPPLVLLWGGKNIGVRGLILRVLLASIAAAKLRPDVERENVVFELIRYPTFTSSPPAASRGTDDSPAGLL